jgi:hypothetical protein
MESAFSSSHRPDIKFDASDAAGFMFKVMHFADIPLLDDLFPPAGSKTP